MTTFFEKLDQRAREIDSLLCVGLDRTLKTAGADGTAARNLPAVD